jgi:hypothetical protein
MLAALVLGEDPTVTNEQKAEFAPDLVWIVCRSKKSITPARNPIAIAWL